MRGLTIAYGSAILVDSPDDHPNVRVYRTRDGRTYWGTDTYELGHVCDLECAYADLTQSGPWEPAGNLAYVGPEKVRTDGTSTGQYATADIGAADYGDDTYVLCDACGHELHRDDEAHYDMYGTHLPPREDA